MTKRPRQRLLAILPYPLGIAPCQRFRIEQWDPFLRADGIDVTYAPALSLDAYRRIHRPGSLLVKAAFVLASTLRHLRGMRSKADAIYLHRYAFLAGPSFFERVVCAGRPVIYDFDDAIYLRDTAPANRAVAFLKRPEKTADLCTAAEAVTVGNGHLATYAKAFNGDVTIVPTSIDTDLYAARPPVPFGGGRRLVFGWTGSASSQRHLELFRPLLEEAFAACPGTKLKVISDLRPTLGSIPMEWEAWDGAREAEQVASFDVGIMPIPDDDWSRGKCAAKALQCMAMGRPVIATPVGANCEVITHGVDGFLAADTNAWIEAMRVLSENTEIRHRMGETARNVVVQRYSMRSSSSLLASVFRRVATRS